MERKLSMEDIQLLNSLERATGARAVDAVITQDSVLFVVAPGQIGKAVGKGGSNVRKLENFFGGKKVEMVEGADSIGEFLSHAFAPAEVISVEEVSNNGKNEAVVKVDENSKGIAIGRNGEKIKRARMLAKRLFNVDDVKIL